MTKLVGWVLYGAYLAAFSLASLAATEWLLGHLAAQAPPERFRFSSFLVRDDLLGFVGAPDSRWRFVNHFQGELVEIEGTTDARGLRPLVTNRDCPDCPEILMAGDSVLFSHSAPDGGTIPELLADTLRRHGHEYRVRNLSYAGWSTIQSHLAVERYLREAAVAGPDVRAVVYAFTPNDVIDNVRYVYRVPVPIVVREEHGFGIALERNDLEEAFSWRWRLAQWLRGLRLTRLFQQWEILTEEASTNVADYRASGLDQRDWDFYFPVRDPTVWHAPFEVDWSERYAFVLAQMRDVAGQRGIPFAVFHNPWPPYAGGTPSEQTREAMGFSAQQMEDFRARWRASVAFVAKSARRLQVDFLPVDQAMFAGFALDQVLSRPDDWHLNPQGNQLVAEDLARLLLPRLRAAQP